MLSYEERRILDDEFGLQHGRDDTNVFLCEAMIRFRKNRETLSPDNCYSIQSFGNITQLWVQTPECKFSRAGYCTVCNYWKGKKNASFIEEMIKSISIPEDCDSLLLNTCGNILDLYEFSAEQQNMIFRWISLQQCKRIILETHISTINDGSIERIKRLLPNKEVFFEFGVESISDDVLFYCLNKPQCYQIIKRANDLIHHIGAYSIANVLLGTPFLTAKEQVDDAVNTILALLRQNVDYVVLFPVNIKPHTLPGFLYDRGLYNVVNADLIIDVLEKIPEKSLDRIDVAWYGEHKEPDTLSPIYCKRCQPDLQSMISLFNSCISSEPRKEVLEDMKRCRCKCLRQQYNIYDEYYQKSFFQRLFCAYRMIRDQ